MDDLKVRVERIRQEAADIKSFRLMAVDASALPPFSPGSHIDVHVGGLVRQYSLCNNPATADHYVIAVKREAESRGGSLAMHEHVREKDVLTISPPRNNFSLRQGATQSLLLGGGIGITPLLSMARHLRTAGLAFQLQYFTRSIDCTAFHDELSAQAWKNHVVFHYALDPAALKTYLRKLLWEHSAGMHLYVCGPRPFMELVQDVAAATWPPDSVHVEYFSADPQALAGPRSTFQVRLARTGTTCLVKDDQSIVSALQQVGVEIPTSCEQGVCGTCLTGVLAGEPDHRDAYLTEEEKACNDKILPCVSRARSQSLTLDL